MNIYSKAPVISRLHPRGIVADGVVPDRDTNLTFNLAVESYGHFVPPNRYLTGAQWIEQISAAYDVTEPRHKAVIDSIKTVMLVDQFEDDHIVIRTSSSEPLFRGKKIDCHKFMIHCPPGIRTSSLRPAAFNLVPTRTVDANTLRLADDNTAIKYLADNFANGQPQRGGFLSRVTDAETRTRHLATRQAVSLRDFGLPVEVLYYPKTEDDYLVRMGRLLLISGLGVPAFETAQHRDRSGCVNLIAALANLHGYGALVTRATGIKLKRPGDDKPRDMLRPTMIERSMMDFIESLEDAGWDGNSDVFVCRPASPYNTLMNVHAHESLVHTQLIGWKIPQGVVQQLAEELHELNDQKDLVHRHGERAA